MSGPGRPHQAGARRSGLSEPPQRIGGSILSPGRRLLPPALVALAAASVAPGAWALAPASGGAPKPVVSLEQGKAKSLALTVYESNLALVHERHLVELPAGSAVVRLAPAPDGLEPRSIQIGFEPAAEVLDQEYASDLISPQRVLDLSVGGEITLIDLDEAGREIRRPARLLSTREGLVVERNGEILLHPEGRIAVPALPAGLLADPVLEWAVRSRNAGERQVDLRYLTSGLNWSADYVVRRRDGSDKVVLTSWVTVENRTGIPYRDASLRLVAGEVHRVTSAPRPLHRMALEAAVADDAGMVPFEARPLLDYHLYALPRPASLPGRGARQFQFHHAPAVAAERRYVVDGSVHSGFMARGPLDRPDRLPVQIRLEMANRSADGLGVPLPAGTVRLYEEDGKGGMDFVGEDRLPHTAADEKVSLQAGNAFDLVAERTQTDYQEIPSRNRSSFEAAFSVRLANRKPSAVRLEVRERVAGDWTVLESSHPHVKLSADTISFSVEVAAGKETVVTYRVRVQ
jgi:hypothetical protein